MKKLNTKYRDKNILLSQMCEIKMNTSTVKSKKLYSRKIKHNKLLPDMKSLKKI